LGLQVYGSIICIRPAANAFDTLLLPDHQLAAKDRTALKALNSSVSHGKSWSCISPERPWNNGA
jgi:hypothetical protein